LFLPIFLLPAPSFPISGFSLSAFPCLLHAGNNPERANAAQAPAPLGANLWLTRFLLLTQVEDKRRSARETIGLNGADGQEE
jgi:hypothetical protein